MKNTIKTYCYGKPMEFQTLDEAKAFYLEGMQNCEGSERDRYADIYFKLTDGIEPYCDCNGVPPVKKNTARKTLTEEDVKRAKEIIREKHDAGVILVALRAKYELLMEEFKRENAELIKDIEAYGTKRNDLALELLKYEKLGFKA